MSVKKNIIEEKYGMKINPDMCGESMSDKLKKVVEELNVFSEVTIVDVENYLCLIHTYNEIKDVAQELVGYLAQLKSSSTKEIYCQHFPELDDIWMFENMFSITVDPWLTVVAGQMKITWYIKMHGKSNPRLHFLDKTRNWGEINWPVSMSTGRFNQGKQ